MKARLFLENWSDVMGETERDDYLDYNALIESDDEFLCLESLFLDNDFAEFCNE